MSYCRTSLGLTHTHTGKQTQTNAGNDNTPDKNGRQDLSALHAQIDGLMQKKRHHSFAKALSIELSKCLKSIYWSNARSWSICCTRSHLIWETPTAIQQHSQTLGTFWQSNRCMLLLIYLPYPRAWWRHLMVGPQKIVEIWGCRTHWGRPCTWGLGVTQRIGTLTKHSSVRRSLTIADRGWWFVLLWGRSWTSRLCLQGDERWGHFVWSDLNVLLA